jgi:hypothetical protein
MVKARASEADAPPPDPARVEAQRDALKSLPQDEYQSKCIVCRVRCVIQFAVRRGQQRYWVGADCMVCVGL